MFRVFVERSRFYLCLWPSSMKRWRALCLKAAGFLIAVESHLRYGSRRSQKNSFLPIRGITGVAA